MSVLPFRPQSPEQVIETLADQVSGLSSRVVHQGIRIADDSLHIDALESANTWLHQRLTKRRERELVAYLIGVGTATVLITALYLLASYDLAQIIERALRSMGL